MHAMYTQKLKPFKSLPVIALSGIMMFSSIKDSFSDQVGLILLGVNWKKCDKIFRNFDKKNLPKLEFLDKAWIDRILEDKKWRYKNKKLRIHKCWENIIIRPEKSLKPTTGDNEN